MEKNRPQFISLSPEQKIGFVLLFVFGVLTIVLGFLQMRNTIYNPFVVRFNNNLSSQSFLDEKTRLQQLDTDNDGLSDYDELEFYKTSAYLPDTDSDGLNDKFEIDNGKDPLCPEGDICEAQITPEENIKTESPILDNANPLDLLNQTEQTAGTENLDLTNIVSDPILLRQLLLSSGKITEEQLSKIDDATLLDLVKNINVNSTSTTGNN